MICPRSLLLCPGYFWGSFQVSGNHMRALDNHWFAYMDRQAARALDFQEEGGDLEGKGKEDPSGKKNTRLMPNGEIQKG